MFNFATSLAHLVKASTYIMHFCVVYSIKTKCGGRFDRCRKFSKCTHARYCNCLIKIVLIERFIVNEFETIERFDRIKNGFVSC